MAYPDPVSETENDFEKTQLLREIVVEYNQETCTYCPKTNEITATFDDRGGARWRSAIRYHHGTFRALVQCPEGNSSGLVFSLYLSSLEGDKTQDEIDFEFLGNDKTIVQTNYFVNGVGCKEVIHELGFDCSDGFHEYMIKWFPNVVEWLIDGHLIRRLDIETGSAFLEKPMFLYASVWDASKVGEGSWAGTYVGCDAPYVCRYKDVRVPIETAVTDDLQGSFDSCFGIQFARGSTRKNKHFKINEQLRRLFHCFLHYCLWLMEWSVSHLPLKNCFDQRFAKADLNLMINGGDFLKDYDNSLSHDSGDCSAKTVISNNVPV